jgi:hypothetical protein
MTTQTVPSIKVSISGIVSETALGTFKHVMLQKLDGSDISWSEKQNVKNSFFGHETFAVECFPPESHLVDVINAYHLWVLDSEGSCPIGWETGRQVLPDGRQANRVVKRNVSTTSFNRSTKTNKPRT